MQKKHILISEAAVLFAALAIFSSLLIFRVTTDIPTHAATVRWVIEGTIAPPANFLFYLLVYVVALFQTSAWALESATAVILAVSVAVKYRITRRYSVELYHELVHGPRDADGRSRDMRDGPDQTASAPAWAIPALAISMLLIFSLPTQTSFYLGQFPPNVWHNSTTIFVTPFALMLFWLSYRQLSAPTMRRLAVIAVLCVINVIAKPSFFLVFVVAYPLMLLRVFGLARARWIELLPVALGIIATTVIYYLTFVQSYGDLYGGETAVVIRPFATWLRWSGNIPLSLFCSLAFPICYCVAYREDLRTRQILQYAALCYAIAIGIFVVFAETGTRASHGNFMWQCIICSYILFWVTAVLFLEKLRNFGLRRWKNRIVLLAFLAHLLAGFVYLGRVFLVTGSAW